MKTRYPMTVVLQTLREFEEGSTILQICARHNISEFTFYRWRREFRALIHDRVRGEQNDEMRERILRSYFQDRVTSRRILRDEK
jgi:hypothetical protein